MKRVISLLLFTFVIGVMPQVIAAQGTSEVTLRVGQERRVASGRVRIKLISVTNDSRCPENARCVWAGNAKVKVQVRVRGGETRVLELNTSERGPGTGPTGGNVDSYRVKLENLTPGRMTNRTIRQKDYRATFSITKLFR